MYVEASPAFGRRRLHRWTLLTVPPFRFFFSSFFCFNIFLPLFILTVKGASENWPELHLAEVEKHDGLSRNWPERRLRRTVPRQTAQNVTLFSSLISSLSLGGVKPRRLRAPGWRALLTAQPQSLAPRFPGVLAGPGTKKKRNGTK